MAADPHQLKVLLLDADSVAPILDDRGAVTGVVDQTEERAALEALRTARRGWQATFDALLDPVALLASDGTVQQHNRAFASISMEVLDVGSSPA
jgi:PAS domain-containing protein